MSPSRPWPPYAKLHSIQPTAFDPGKPIREIRLTLDGDMERYVWLLNNKAFSESDVIRIREGAKEMDMGPLEGPNKLIAHVIRLVLWVGDG